MTGARVDIYFCSVGTSSQILVGEYQLEIRGGTEYGAPRRQTSPRSAIEIDLIRSFAPNETQSRSQSIRFIDAVDIPMGKQF